MTSELEQEFFKVFGVDEQCVCPCFPEYKENGCEICIKYFQGKKDCNEKNQYKYPDITADKLLELICILNDFDDGHYEAITLEELKQEVLEDLIYYHNAIGNIANQELKDKVLSLFKVGAEDE